MVFTRSKSRPLRTDRPRTGDRARDGDTLYLFEQQWVEKWIRATALLLGFDADHIYNHNDNVVCVLRKTVRAAAPANGTSDVRSIIFYVDGGVVLSESTLMTLIKDPKKRYHFIGGRKDEFFADGPT